MLDQPPAPCRGKGQSESAGTRMAGMAHVSSQQRLQTGCPDGAVCRLGPPAQEQMSFCAVHPGGPALPTGSFLAVDSCGMAHLAPAKRSASPCGLQGVPPAHLHPCMLPCPHPAAASPALPGLLPTKALGNSTL